MNLIGDCSIFFYRWSHFHNLFVCKLNSVTKKEEIIKQFSIYGCLEKVKIVKDYIIKDSLCYGFVDFVNSHECEQAYLSSNNMCLDDRRLLIDFNQK